MACICKQMLGSACGQLRAQRWEAHKNHRHKNHRHKNHRHKNHRHTMFYILVKVDKYLFQTFTLHTYLSLRRSTRSQGFMWELVCCVVSQLPSTVYHNISFPIVLIWLTGQPANSYFCIKDPAQSRFVQPHEIYDGTCESSWKVSMHSFSSKFPRSPVAKDLMNLHSSNLS